jgi:predicted Zn-dependent protease with MMP-like domain
MLIQEIAHHFGLSDAHIAQLERGMRQAWQTRRMP